MMLLTRGRSAWTVLLLAALAQPVAAQVPGIGNAKSTPATQQVPDDPLGRSTPRGTIAAFIRAVDRSDFVSAARYMQLSESQRRNAETLARDLKSLMDRYFTQSLLDISDSPNGALDDGLPMDRERVGPLTIGDKTTDVALVRVTDPQAGRVWFISSETLALVPVLKGSVAQTWIERVMPASLMRRELLGTSLGHWVALAGTLVIPFILLMLLAGAIRFLVRQIVDDAARRRELDAWYTGLRWPAIAVLVLTIQLSSMRLLGFPLTFRLIYARVGLFLFVIALTWLLRRLVTLGFARARGMMWARDRTSTRSLMLLGERLVKALVVVIAILAILTIVGVNTKTALAGLGIGGVALALGAQKTIENFLGGVFLLSDRALAVGDQCQIGGRVGWVEDITLRSVRLRTLDRTLVSVPAGVLAQAGIENFATREKILVQTILRLRYGTSAGQLRRILDRVRALLAQNPKIEPQSSRIRLVNFGEQAVELELFAYVLTADVPEFLAVREELLLDVASIVESLGSAFAQPTQFIYMDDKTGADVPVRTAVARDSVPRDARSGPPFADAPAEITSVSK